MEKTIWPAVSGLYQSTFYYIDKQYVVC